MQPSGALAPIFGPIFGAGPGAGLALMLTVFGLLGVLVGVAGYLFPAIRNAEDILPDHVATTAEPNRTATVTA